MPNSARRPHHSDFHAHPAPERSPARRRHLSLDLPSGQTQRLRPGEGHRGPRHPGEPQAATREAIRTFRAHDEATLAQQYEVKDDAEKLLATSRAAARQLQHLFEADEVYSPEPKRRSAR
jgi:hypothetical protein